MQNVKDFSYGGVYEDGVLSPLGQLVSVERNSYLFGFPRFSV